MPEPLVLAFHMAKDRFSKNVLFLPPPDLVVGLEGPRGPFGTGKSSCMCRVATISLHLAVFSKL